MERLQQTATVVAALIVGAAVVILWPRPDPAPSSGQRPEAESTLPEAATTTAPPTPPRPVQAPASEPVLDPSLLREHLEDAEAHWRALARQARGADDDDTRALAPRLEALAEQAPEGDPHFELQPAAAFLLAELAMVEELEASGLEAEEFLEELTAIREGWIGEGPVR